MKDEEISVTKIRLKKLQKDDMYYFSKYILRLQNNIYY